MWDFELLPLSGGAPVPVPPGQTILGRGPLLGVSDKRVSRNHALLENSDGRLRLKPTHVNPCFLQTSSDPEPLPLTRDQWRDLRTGDTVSLLPGQLCFRVVLSKPDQDLDLDLDLETEQKTEEKTEEEAEGTQRNSQTFVEGREEEEEAPGVAAVEGKSSPIGPDQTQTPPTGKMDQSHEEEVTCSFNKSLTQTQSRSQSSSVPRTRVLPAWMMSAVSQASSSSTTYSPRAVKKSKTSGSRQTTPPVMSSAEKATPHPVTSSAEKATPHPVMSSAEKATPHPVMSSAEKATSRPVTSSAKKAPPPEMSSSEWVGPSEEEEQPKKKRRKMNGSEPQASAPVLSPDPGPGPGPGPGSGPVPAAAKDSSSTTNKRPPCPYGRDCYRKNPVHFQEESHPGDPDYEEPDQDQDQEDSERPECPYGTDCYRKNPLHRKEFRHSQRPGPKTRPAAAKRRAAADEEEEDDDEYESSFIDDDSDYEPPRVQSESDSEDLSQLEREAAGFIRNRK